MRKKFLLSSILLMAFALFVASSYAYGPNYYSDEDVKVDVKKIDKGIQITLISDDPEVAKDIQDNLRWYRDSFKYGEDHCPYAQGGKMSYRHGCMYNW